MRRETVNRFLQNFVNGRPTFIKAASLIDIALWDLSAKSVQLPLFKLLGGIREKIPVMAVAGYYLDQRTIEDVSREVGELAQEGYSRIKVMILGNDLAFDERFVRSAHAQASQQLCVDAHWAWRSLADAYRTCRALDEIGLRFIEDPFGPFQASLTGELQRMLRTPLACGEDAPDTGALLKLAEDVPILRIDATTCGGVTAATGIIETADLMGRTVLPHVFLPIHAQLAGALSAVEAVELIPEESGACPMFELLERRPNISNGILSIDMEPGAGLDLRWDVVERYATKTFSRELSH
jgi:L-alanine-DL-glutamate epimerase-like enolase superfamily enzyme